jgi:hypothetical protein
MVFRSSNGSVPSRYRFNNSKIQLRVKDGEFSRQVQLSRW